MNTIILNATTAGTVWLTSILGTGNPYNDILMVVLVIFMATVLVASLTILKALRGIVRITMPEVLEQEKAAKAAGLEFKTEKKARRKKRWNNLLGLRPIEEEKDLVMDHEFDGISELDNPVPIWFNGLFYATVAFAVVYLSVYHVFGWGPNQDEEYVREMAAAEKAKQEYLAQAANLVDENTVTIDASVQTLNAGKATFITSCAVCHGQLGEGGIGPNLTDQFWLHGGELADIFKVVKYGVLDKGMVPWEQSLTPAQIAEVSNYVLSLRGTTPPNPKEPQGMEVEYAVTGTEGEQVVTETSVSADAVIDEQ